HIRQRMCGNECCWINFLDLSDNSSNLQPRDDAIKNFLFFLGQTLTPDAARTLENGDSAPQIVDDRVLNFRVLGSNDRNSRVLLDAMEQEVNCSRRRCVRQNRVQSRLHTQEKGRRQKDSDVEDQNNVTNLKQVTAATDEQRGDFCSIQ